MRKSHGIGRGLLAGALCIVAAAAAADPCPWAGAWDTNYGTIDMTQPRESVYGNYTWDDGLLYGSTSDDGDILSGTWHEAPSYAGPRDAGRFEFVMDPDCKGFEGVWNYLEDDPEFWRAEWNGVRTSPLPPSAVLVTDAGYLAVNGRPAPAGAATPLPLDAWLEGVGDSYLTCEDELAAVLLLHAMINGPELQRILVVDGVLAEPIAPAELTGSALLNIQTSPLIQSQLEQACDGRRRESSGELATEVIDATLERGRVRFGTVPGGPTVRVRTAYATVTADERGWFQVEQAVGLRSRITAMDVEVRIVRAGGGGTLLLRPGDVADASPTGISPPFPDVLGRLGFET